MIQAAVKALNQRLPAMLLYISSTGSLLIGIGAQTAGFIILARFLGTNQYGYLATISAVTNLGAPLCGLGAAEVMRRWVGRDPGLYPEILGHCLILLGATGVVIVTILTAGLDLFVPALDDSGANFILMLLIVSSNVVFYTWILFVEQVFLAHREFKRANIVNASFGIARALTVLVACIGFGVDRLLPWAMWNAGLYVSASLAGVAAIWSYGPPRWRLVRDELTPGITISIAGLLWTLRQNIDLLALSSIETSAVIGAYGVARRIIGTASIIGASLDRLIYPKLAVAGRNGPSATLRLAKKYAVYAIVISVPTCLALFLVAPILPWIFGKDFGQAVYILKVLVWTLIFLVLQNVAFDALNAADRHRSRFVAGTAAGLLGIGLIAGLTYRYGMTGTFIASYLSDGIMVFALWMTLGLLSYHQKRAELR